MALLQNTSLETHPSGTLNLNGIINGNWAILDTLYGALAGTAGITTITYGATITLALGTSKPLNQSLLTGAAAIAVSGKAAGLSRILILVGDGTDRALTWPTGAVWTGEALDTLPADSTRAVMVLARGTTDADLVLVNLAGGSGGGSEPPDVALSFPIATVTIATDDYTWPVSAAVAVTVINDIAAAVIGGTYCEWPVTQDGPGAAAGTFETDGVLIYFTSHGLPYQFPATLV